MMNLLKYKYALTGTLLALGNLYLSYLFRYDLVPLKLPFTLVENLLFLDKPIYNYGGFFIYIFKTEEI